jgi:amidase
MGLKRPKKNDLDRIARENYFSLSEEETRVLSERIDRILTSYDRLESMASLPSPSSTRNKGHRPSKKENKYGAWAWMCSIKQRNSGALHGKKIAVKDNVSVAGIPLANGSSILRDFVPDEDATVVKRILSAGGEIVGKAQCENLCVSGGSHTSFPQVVRNPYDPDYMTGGSSSGSAALLASGEVDLAIGGDQAGSIRIPSSWCGVFGLKPTWGLVPYTGAVPMEMSLDHLGPMANSVEDLALLLDVIAGRDEFDLRQRDTPFVLPRYSQEIHRELNGLKIGVVKEGFDWKGLSEEDVDLAVKREAKSFQKLGAHVKEISIPEHHFGVDVWTAVVMEGTWNTDIKDNGLEHCGSGYNNVRFVESWASARKQRSEMLPPSMKLISLLGNYLGEKYNGRYFALSQNLRRALTQAYDRAFKEFDLLAMPTTPQKAQPFKEMSIGESLDATMINLNNTCSFDVTGHPAINIPCGESRGLPIGMMLIGRRFDEATILSAAYSYEHSRLG